MSAFMVSHTHISALLNFAIRHRVNYSLPGGSRVEISVPNATRIGRDLLAENNRSIHARYGDDESAHVNSYAYSANPKFEKLDAADIIQACDCFDYQACETDDYKESLAYLIVDRIRSAAVRELTQGCSTWHIDD